ncbi:MAG: hypothetical protein ACE5EL_08780, partial [Anaerolineae bacterium]
PRRPPAAPTATAFTLPLLPPTPVRTQRPTRTPRSVTPSPTPPSTAALRLTLSSDPAAPAVGQKATFLAELRNVGQFAVADVLVEFTLPAGMAADEVSSVSGTTQIEGPVVRWLLPSLSANGSSRLTILGTVPPSAAGGMSFCAALLSVGAPLEHCIGLAARRGTRPGAPTELVPLGTGAGGLDAPGPEGGLGLGQGLQWLALVVGLAALGLWFGTAARMRRG